MSIKKLTKYFLLSFSLYASISLFIQLYGTIFELLFVLPLFYLISISFFNYILQRNPSIQISIYTIFIYSFIRLVLIPFLASHDIVWLSHSFTGVNFSSVLMLLVYEHFTICLLLVIWKYPRLEYRNITLSLSGSLITYKFFIFYTIIILIFFGLDYQLFDFVIKTVDFNFRPEENLDRTFLFVRETVTAGIAFAYLVILYTIQKYYYFSYRKTLSVFFAIVITLLLVSVIIGERRSYQIMTSFAASWTLIRLFPAERKKILVFIVSGSVFVLLMLTVYKHFYAFLYDSYMQAIESTNLNDALSVNVLDSYFYGIGTVSENLKFVEKNNGSIGKLAYDFFSNIFGLSFMFRGSELNTSQLYNYTIYSGAQTTGYLFSSLAYSTYFFGYVFSPVFSILNVLLAIKLEISYKKANSIEKNFLLSFLFMRVAFGIFGSPIAILNFITRFFVLNYMIYVLATFVKRKKLI